MRWNVPTTGALALAAVVGVSLIGGLFASASAAPAVDARLTSLQHRLSLPDQAEAATGEFPGGMVSMFVDGDIDESSVMGLGGSVGVDVSGLKTVRIPAAALSKFLSSQSAMHSATLADKMEFQTITSVPSTGANSFWTVAPTTGTFSGLTGKGVIIGIIDSGIDFRHADFKNAQGKTRVLDIWDQYSLLPTHPTGFSYGYEWTAAQIDAGLCTLIDGIGHGTFTAGVAAGNGRGSVPSQPKFKYIGMAPEADIIAVNVVAYDTYYVDAVKYVFDKARALNEPAVCLIAAGKRPGPHDGTDPSEIAISNLVRDYGPNRLVVAAAGNYGATAIHGSAQAVSGTPGQVTLTVPATTPPTMYKIAIDGWYPASANFSITVKTPSGTTVGPVVLNGLTDLQTVDAEVVIGNGRTLNSKGDKNVSVQFLTNTINSTLKAGTFTITATAVSGSGKIDYWLGDYSLGGPSPAFATGVSFNETVLTPATADSVISVGAFTYRTTWTAAGNTMYGLSGSPVLNDIASWSGHGNRRDGQTCPDLTAAGQAIGSSRSGWMAISGVYVLPDSVHVIQTGTSVAAAHVAGALALELQNYKQAGHNMSAAIARQWLRTSAVTDNFVTAAGAVPNPVWGAGKLHISTGPVTGVPVDPGYFQFASPYPSPSRSSTAFQFSLGVQDQKDAAKGVVIQLVDVRGRIVHTLKGKAVLGPQRLEWSGQDEQGATVGAGVYFARLVVGDKVTAQKFVRLSPL